MRQTSAAKTRPESQMAAHIVKRVSRNRSNKKPARPKQKGLPKGRPVAPEIVEAMPPEVIATAEPDGAALAVAAAAAVQGKIVLGASCTIHEAPALRAHLIAQAAHPGPYEIDGSAVQHIDTAGVQLVVAFALDCLERSIHYVWTGRSATLDEAIRTLGVGALLESPGGPGYSPGGGA
jgi:phospholipid transport system transporter-binding protein